MGIVDSIPFFFHPTHEWELTRRQTCRSLCSFPPRQQQRTALFPDLLPVKCVLVPFVVGQRAPTPSQQVEICNHGCRRRKACFRRQRVRWLHLTFPFV